MDPARLGFFPRFWLAIVLFWKLLFSGALAARVRLAARGEAVPPALGGPDGATLPGGIEAGERPAGVSIGATADSPEAGTYPAVFAEAGTHPTSVAPEPAPAPAGPDPTPALQLLSIMQREGRFIDFLQENVAGYSDAEVGAAARVVHEGCKRGLEEYLVLEPVRREAEGAPVVLDRGFDAARTRVTGNVVGQPPYRGRLAHHGWQVAEIRLPRITDGHDPRIVAPAEIEL